MTEEPPASRGASSPSGEVGFSLALAVKKYCIFVVRWHHINDLDYQRDEHRVHLTVNHLIWCPKRRKAVLVGTVAQECERLIRATCEQYGWTVLEVAVQPDHVHLCVRVFPTNAASEVIKEVKAFTAHELRATYPELKRLPSLWTRSYFASTAGLVSQETITRYLEAQKGL